MHHLCNALAHASAEQGKQYLPQTLCLFMLLPLLHACAIILLPHRFKQLLQIREREGLLACTAPAAWFEVAAALSESPGGTRHQRNPQNRLACMG
jgi:hypothetical protein